MAISSRILGKSGLTLTSLGFGGGPIGWRDTKDVEAEADRLIKEAWNAGVRYFDTAPYYGYGNSELRVGKGLQHRNRGEFVISTKVGRLIRPRFPGDRSEAQVIYDYSYEATLQSIEESLSRLKLSCIDIALIHDIDHWTHKEQQPMRFQEALKGSYRALSDLKARGSIKAIGIGVNEWEVCYDFAREAPVDCILLAGQHSLLRQVAERELFPYCEMHNIGIIVGGPYNSGILASGAVPGAKFDYAPAKPGVVARVRQIEKICNQFGVPLAAAALLFTLRHPAVTTVIPGVTTVQEIATTVENYGAPIPMELWAELRKLGTFQ
jgi:D-threo-aldose 1-dehydrogenase